MRRIVHKYQISKYKRFTNGLLFAIITMIAVALCLTAISDHTAGEEILLPFGTAIISMLLGIISMFGNNAIPKEKV